LLFLLKFDHQYGCIGKYNKAYWYFEDAIGALNNSRTLEFDDLITAEVLKKGGDQASRHLQERLQGGKTTLAMDDHCQGGFGQNGRKYRTSAK
jgi:hypothetical protein